MRQKSISITVFVLIAVFGWGNGVLAQGKQAAKAVRKSTLALNIVKVPVFPSPKTPVPNRQFQHSPANGFIPVPYQLSEITLPDDVTKEAKTALEKVLPQLVKGDEGYAKKLGFQSEEEVNNSMIGRPLQVFEIGLRQLRRYEQEPFSLANLLRYQVWNREENPVPTRLVYPICLKGNPTCTPKTIRSLMIITFSSDDLKWHLAGLGFEALIKGLFQYKKEGEDSFIVWVPALNGYYLGSYQQNSIRIIPLVKDPHFPYTPGKPVPENFFTILKKEARKIKINEEKAY